MYKNLATSGFVKVVYEHCDADECLDKLHDICPGELRYHNISVNTNVWVGGFRVAATKGLSVCSFFGLPSSRTQRATVSTRFLKNNTVWGADRLGRKPDAGAPLRQYGHHEWRQTMQREPRDSALPSTRYQSKAGSTSRNIATIPTGHEYPAPVAKQLSFTYIL